MSAYDFLIQHYESFIQMPHHPVYLMLGLILISFLFEDVAVAAGVSLSTAGSLLWVESFLAVFCGIAIGDLLLYAAGYFSRKIPFFKRRFVDPIKKEMNPQKNHKLAGAVLLARVTPGLRLVSYVYLGLKHSNFLKFLLLVMVAVFVWCATLYLGSIYLGEAIAYALPIPKSIAVAIPLLFMALIAFSYPWFKEKWGKK